MWLSTLTNHQFATDPEENQPTVEFSEIKSEQDQDT